MSILTQLTAALASRYDVEREIGAGGMATVYLARDVKHDRRVALKVLNPELGAVLGVERFLSEIRVTANLQHPNLLPLFDSGEANGLLFYVMPFIEGESLRARLTREKQLPVDEAVRISVAVADALEYAHQHGVIHRDLKPENILLQHGQPVVADFGIALAVSNAGGARVTQTGLSLGTPQYMSPEQATGDRVIDGRTDLYSLGAMLYEMLVGDPPHTASTAQAIVAKVLTERPTSVQSSRPAVPDHVAHAVELALEKLPADRWATARDMSQAMQGRVAGGTTMLRSTRTVAKGWPRWAVIAPSAVALAAVTALAVVWAGRSPATTPEPVRFAIGTRDSIQPVDGLTWSVSASPDGRTILFTGLQNGKQRLYLRPIDQLLARPVLGSEGAAQQVFSPDGKWIAFQVANKLKKVPVEGGTPIDVADLTALNGMDWGGGDVIVAGSMGATHGLSRTSAAGGAPFTALTQRDRATKEVDHLWPVVLADGKTVLFTIWYGTLESSKLAVTSLDDGKVTPLDIKALAPLGVFDGQLVYVRVDGVVMAVPFNVGSRKVTGTPIPVADHIAVCSGCNGDAKVRIARNGTMVYLTGTSAARLVWINERGQETPVFEEAKAFSSPRISPDGKRISVAIQSPAGMDSWILDIASKTLSKLSAEPLSSVCSWTTDSKSVVYRANGGYYKRAISGGGEPEKLAVIASGLDCPSLSPDGQTLIYTTYRDNNADLIALSLGDKKSVPIGQSTADEAAPSFSPDSKWVAYASNISGRHEIYVSSLADPRARVQISDKGGVEPIFSSDGRHIYYREGLRVIAANLAIGPAPSVASRAALFEGTYYNENSWRAYDVTAGPKFVMIKPHSAELEIVVVANWLTELARKTAKH